MDIDNNKILEAEQQEPLQQEKIQNQAPEAITLPKYQQKPLFNLVKGDTAFALCAVITSIFTSIFGIFGGFAFGYVLSITLMAALLIVYFAKGHKVSIRPIIYGLLSLANGAVFICTTNIFVKLFGAIISFLLMLVCLDGLINGISKGNRHTLGIFYSAASTIDNIDISVKSLFSNDNGSKKTIGKVLLGLLCAVPVLIIVVPLLISSDDAFRGMMSSIFSNTLITILKMIFGIMISVFIITYGFSLKAGRVAKIKRECFAGIENIYIISFLSAIGVCYLLYLFSQLAYFFSAFKGFLPEGEITYAQYARKGFFEMCIIAVINLAIVFLCLLLSKKQNGKVCHSIKAITTYISLFTLTIIATAISKMMLYISAYGMTVLRLTTSAFMLFLGVTFISVILQIYITKVNVAKTALIAAGCIVLMLGVCNTNAICAKYNYEFYKSQKLNSIDVTALYNLGDEGIPYIVKLTCSNDEYVAKEAQRYLVQAYLYDYFDDIELSEELTLDYLKQHKKYHGFKSFSLPKHIAYDNLYSFIEKNPNYIDMFKDYFNLSQQEYYYK